MYRVTLKIFAVLVVQDIHVVLILIFKLLSFLHLSLVTSQSLLFVSTDRVRRLSHLRSIDFFHFRSFVTFSLLYNPIDEHKPINCYV